MKFCADFRLLLALLSMADVVVGKFYRQSSHRSRELTGNDVTLNVISEIPGTVKWIPTNRSYLSVIVKVTSTEFEVINTTDILFTSDNYSVSLEIRTSGPQEPAAAVQSTGSRTRWQIGSHNFVIVLLLWATIAILDVRGANGVIAVLFLQTFVSGTFHFEDLPISVEIVIKTPRHFRYKDINLAVNNGTVRITDEIYQTTQEVRCNTDQSVRGAGCDNCCYGNGVCFNNTCLCDDNFDSEKHCRVMKRRDILFTNPVDPRLSQTILPSGTVLDLSPVGNSKDPRQRSSDQSKLRVKTRDPGIKDTTFHFEKNGFLRRIKHERTSIVFRRKKNFQCLMLVIVKKGRLQKRNFTIDLCESSAFGNVVNGTGTFFNRSFAENSLRRLQRRNAVEESYRHIPVKFDRCAHDAQNDVLIYFKVNQDSETSEHSGDKNLKDVVYFHTHYRPDRHYLKIPSRGISDEDIQGKCHTSMLVQDNICKHDYLSLYSFICDNITRTEVINENKHNTSVANLSSEAAVLCSLLTQTLDSYCQSIRLSEDDLSSHRESCLTRYTDAVDLFAEGHVTLTPSVVLPDGEVVTKEDIIVQIPPKPDASITEIVLKEDLPEFKVVDISVIPKDPVPEKTYKVRLDYACATNATVIKMNVTGSDKYSSHVTCHGITDCNCCMVSAAGAPDAVIDYVSVRIIDELVSTDIYREMVVIF